MKRTLLTALAFTLAAPAFAEPGGVSSVSGPGVTAGETAFEARTAAFDGGTLDGNWSHRVQAEHGFTEWWQAALILRASQPDGESAELSSVGLENRIDFVPTRDWPVHFGVQGEYKFGVHGRDDEVEFKLLAEHDAGPLSARFNYIVERAVDEDADWETGYAAHLMWDATDAVTLGVEAYGEIDAEAHAVGPRANFDVGPVTLGVSYLTGLDEAEADQQFRLSLEWSP